MKTKFYYAYCGSKYNEMPEIIKFVNLDNITDIVEPFCGSCAFTFYIYEQHKNKYKYHVSDNDNNLIKLLSMIKKNPDNKKQLYDNLMKFKDMTREQWKEISKKQEKTLIEYLLMKVYNVKSSQCMNPVGYRSFPKLEKFLKHNPYDDFLKDVDIKLEDYKHIMEKYKNDNKALLFIDPPYLESSYSLYAQKQVSNVSSDFYKYINDYFKTAKCKIIMVLRALPLIDIVFEQFIKHTYQKKYDLSKKTVNHIIISNY